MKKEKIKLKTKKKKKSYKKLLSDKTYKKYINLKKKKKLTKKKEKKLDKELNNKYCKCVKRVRKKLYKKNKGGEYPICTSSIYNKRGFKPPKNKNKNC